MEWIISIASLVVAIIALYKSLKVSKEQLTASREMNELQRRQLELQESVAAFQKAQYEEEHKRPNLSEEEKRILLMLAKGATISVCDSLNGPTDAVIYGVSATEKIDVAIFQSLTGYGFLKETSDKGFKISDQGRKAAQKLSE